MKNVHVAAEKYMGQFNIPAILELRRCLHVSLFVSVEAKSPSQQLQKRGIISSEQPVQSNGELLTQRRQI